MTAVTEEGREVPIAGPVREASSSPDQLRDCVRALAVEHDVEPLHGRVDGLATGTTVGQLHLAFVRYGAPTRVVAAPTQELLCWTAPVGPMGVQAGQSRVDQRTAGFLLERADATVMLPDPARGAVVLTTKEQRLAQHFAALTGRSPESLALDAVPAYGKGLLDSAWRHTALLLRSAPAPSAALARSIEEALLTALLLELSEAAPRLLLSDDDVRSVGRVHAERAADWVRERLAEPITVTDWATGVGLSVRHLQRAFREAYGCSPGQFLLTARLAEAHRRLARAGPGDTVTTVAAGVGCTHLGRFSAAYRERYGCPPSVTLRRG